MRFARAILLSLFLTIASASGALAQSAAPAMPEQAPAAPVPSSAPATVPVVVTPNLSAATWAKDLQQLDGPPGEPVFADHFTLKVRVINRMTDELTDLTLRPNEPVNYKGRLLFTAVSCLRDHQGIPGNHAAYLSIRDMQGKVVFAGWMLRAFPGLSTFEEPRTDVLLLSCEQDS